MPSSATACPLDCPDACGVLVETDDDGRFVRLGGNPEHSYSRGSLCGKTAIFGDLLNAENRLRQPLLRKPDGEFEAVSWERAIERIVERTTGLAGERILSLNYAGCMGIVNSKYPLRVMHELGATETDGGICDNTATAGFETVFGHVIGADIETLADTDMLILWGVEARRTHQHLMRSIQDLCQRGVPVIAIDIWRSDTIRSLEKWGGR
ncbi:MAG: anaerobic selenocysteine-containing dehydrogenase, partial [Planctomycetota bacterium]